MKIDVTPAALGGRDVREVAAEAVAAVTFPCTIGVVNDWTANLMLGDMATVVVAGATTYVAAPDADSLNRTLTDAAFLAAHMGIESGFSIDVPAELPESQSELQPGDAPVVVKGRKAR